MLRFFRPGCSSLCCFHLLVPGPEDEAKPRHHEPSRTTISGSHFTLPTAYARHAPCARASILHTPKRLTNMTHDTLLLVLPTAQDYPSIPTVSGSASRCAFHDTKHPRVILFRLDIDLVDHFSFTHSEDARSVWTWISHRNNTNIPSYTKASKDLAAMFARLTRVRPLSGRKKIEK